MVVERVCEREGGREREGEGQRERQPERERERRDYVRLEGEKERGREESSLSLSLSLVFSQTIELHRLLPDYRTSSSARFLSFTRGFEKK